MTKVCDNKNDTWEMFIGDGRCQDMLPHMFQKVTDNISAKLNKQDWEIHLTLCPDNELYRGGGGASYKYRVWTKDNHCLIYKHVICQKFVFFRKTVTMIVDIDTIKCDDMSDKWLMEIKATMSGNIMTMFMISPSTTLAKTIAIVHEKLTHMHRISPSTPLYINNVDRSISTHKRIKNVLLPRLCDPCEYKHWFEHPGWKIHTDIEIKKPNKKNKNDDKPSAKKKPSTLNKVIKNVTVKVVEKSLTKIDKQSPVKQMIKRAATI